MLKVQQIQFFQQHLRTRFPFRYGIASMSDVPHLFVRATIEVDGVSGDGISADLLPPKWFTKDPHSDFETHDLPEMQRVIQHAAQVACELNASKSFFSWWHELYSSQSDWAEEHDIAPLLSGFGVSLVERAVIDAFCRSHNSTFHQLLLSNRFEIQLGEIRHVLGEIKLQDILERQPRKSIRLRHTIGMGDPLTEADITPEDRVDDGLPQSLEASIRAYGLTHFKIKLSGNLEQDRDRLLNIARLLQSETDEKFHFTMDGNENYSQLDHFRHDFTELCTEPILKDFFQRGLLFVEQPLHREHALDPSVRDQLDGWNDAPPMIIDESDGELGSLPTALELGYHGTSHKNCKGVIKGLANAALIFQRKQHGHDAILSSEDLANVGPVALLQDLTVIASLGIEHSERNGHHYFAGLSQFPQELQDRVLEIHPDLYRQSKRGFPTLAPSDGTIQFSSLLNSPFGTGIDPTMNCFDWRETLA